MKMLNILRFWASKGVDAFRCDMAHMVPLEFWQWAIPNVKDRYPRIKFIAELYDVKIYRDFIEKGGFDYLYDKVNLYDTLRGIQCSNYSAATITNCWQTVEGISDKMLNFLENHDEQRFGSKFYAGDPAKVIPSLVISSMISTGPMMIYAGQELGEQATDTEGFSGYDGRTTIFDYWSVATLRRWYNHGNPDGSQLTPRERWLRNKYCTILGLCNRERAISNGRFFDLMYVNYHNPTLNPHRQYAFIRSYDGETLIIAVNFSADSCDLAINIPRHAFDMLQHPRRRGVRNRTHHTPAGHQGTARDKTVQDNDSTLRRCGLENQTPSGETYSKPFIMAYRIKTVLYDKSKNQQTARHRDMRSADFFKMSMYHFNDTLTSGVTCC